MQVIHPEYGVFNKMALQLAGVFAVMVVCGLILGFLGRTLFGRRFGAALGGVGAIIGLFLAFKIGL